MQIALESNVPHVARNVWLSGFQMFILFEVVINEPTFPLSHTLQATCGTLHFQREQTPYSHLAKQGAVLSRYSMALGTKFPLKSGRAATDEIVGRLRPKLAS